MKGVESDSRVVNSVQLKVVGERQWVWCLPNVHASSHALIQPIGSVFSRKLLLWLIYSCNNSFFSLPPYASFDGQIPVLLVPSPKEKGWNGDEQIWNMLLFLHLKKTCRDKRPSLQHINAQFRVAIASAPDRPALLERMSPS